MRGRIECKKFAEPRLEGFTVEEFLKEHRWEG